MRRRSPFLLWRWIGADLLRLIGLAAAVLVSVIALAATVKPVSDGLLQAENLVKFIFYSVPPMLAYALPFAAGFGATLVYHRLAADNESTAAHAGGISHRSLIVPAALVGIVLSLLLATLNELVTRDLATWVIQEIDKGKSVNVGGMMLHAASAQRVAPAPGSSASDVLYLTRVAAIEHDQTLRPVTEVTSERAWILLFPFDRSADAGTSAGESESTRVVMRLENLIGSRDGQGGGGARKSIDVGWKVGSAFRDNVKFLSYRELSDLAAHPERINWVDVWRKDAAVHVAQREASLELRDAVTRREPLVLLDDQGSKVTLSAATMTADTSELSGRVYVLTPPAGGKIEMRLTRHGVNEQAARSTLTVQAAQARIYIDVGTDRFDRSLSISVEMNDVTVIEDQGGQRSERATFSATNLRTSRDIQGEMLALSGPEVLERARNLARMEPPSATFSAAINDLDKAIVKLSREVTAKRHERIAMDVSCFVMVIAGAVIALRLSKRLPMTVYMFTFIPAVVCIVTISGGQQMTVQTGTTGLYLLWSGVAGLLLYTFLQFRALSRH
ncbi:MAG: LptF/LptG family permease [Planctomycetota bacterium]|nr:LptF/LptG family permease [Planctomycetota bacterium]